MSKPNIKEAADFPPPFRLSEGYRPRCFFDIQINKVEAGRLVFELFSDICPKTAENFRALCTGEKGEGKTTSKPLHYKNCILHRIVKNFVIQGGDFVSGDGTGGESIYGGQFKDENFDLHHDRPFLLSMANCGANTNGSQFFITLAASHHLDNVHTVFGYLVDGHDIVRDMENQKVNQKHKPYADIRIAHSGELIKKTKTIIHKPKTKTAKKVKSSSSESESDDSDLDHRKKRKHRGKKEKKKKPPESPEVSAKDAEPSKDDLNFIPSVPMTFLMRRSRTPSPIREKRRQEGLSDTHRREPVLRTRVNMVSKSGKKLRGRGVMRYRTPSPETDSDGGGDVPLTEADSHMISNDGAIQNLQSNVARPSNSLNFDSTVRKPVPRERSPIKVKARRRTRSRSRSREYRRRRKSRSLSKSRRGRRDRSRSRQRISLRRSRSRSVNRYRRSPHDRKPRYKRKRSDSRPRRIVSPVRFHKREHSVEKKGKFERHQSDSDSDSFQERKAKASKQEEIKVPSELEKSQAALTTTTCKDDDEKLAVHIQETTNGEETLSADQITNVDSAESSSKVFEAEGHTEEMAVINQVLQDQSNEIEEEPKEDNVCPPNMEDNGSLLQSVVQEVTGVSDNIESGSSESKEKDQVDELIATILGDNCMDGVIEEEKTGNNTSVVVAEEAIIEPSKVEKEEIQISTTNQTDYTEDAVIKQSKEKIDELQEKIREFKELNLHIGVPVPASPVEENKITSPMNYLKEDSGKAKKTKYKMDEKVGNRLSADDKKIDSKVSSKRKTMRSDSEIDTDDSIDVKFTKKKSKKPISNSSSAESSAEERHRKSSKKNNNKRWKKKGRKKPVTSSSESDSELSSSDNESDVEADRDNKRYKHKTKVKKDIEKGHRNTKKAMNKKKKYSDYTSSDEERKTKKKIKKKQYSSSYTTSAESSDSGSEYSRKKVKKNRKERGRKRRKSIST